MALHNRDSTVVPVVPLWDADQVVALWDAQNRPRRRLPLPDRLLGQSVKYLVGDSEYVVNLHDSAESGNIEERMGEVQGQDRIEFIIKYHARVENTQLKYFNVRGEPRLRRADVNDRLVVSSTDELMDTLKQSGFMNAMRGDLVCIEAPINPDDTNFTPSEHALDHDEMGFDFIAGGTLMQAGYKLMHFHGDCHFAKKMRSEGIPKVTVLKQEIPQGVVEWWVSEANQWHGGLGFTCVQQVTTTATVEARWRQKKKAEEISSTRGVLPGGETDGSYLAQYKDFVMTGWPAGKYWYKWSHYLMCNTFRRDLTRFGLLLLCRTAVGMCMNSKLMAAPGESKRFIQSCKELLDTIF